VQHNTGAYRGGVDIQSDTDFLSLPTICVCPGDLNGDKLYNGLDIQRFVDCYMAYYCPSPHVCPRSLRCICLCADMTTDGRIDDLDAHALVSWLLLAEGCE